MEKDDVDAISPGLKPLLTQESVPGELSTPIKIMVYVVLPQGFQVLSYMLVHENSWNEDLER